MKIRIFGATASGKSTLAKYLGEQLNLPIFSTDKVKYPNNFEIEIPETERNKYIQKNIKQKWIVEGVHYEKWCKVTYENSDIILILEKSTITLIYRIIKRTLKIKKLSLKNKIKDIIKLIKMIFKYSKKENHTYEKLAKNNNKPFLIIKNNNYKKILDIIKSNHYQ